MEWVIKQRIVTGPMDGFGRPTGSEYDSIVVLMDVKEVGKYGLPEYRVSAKYGLSGKAHTRMKRYDGETAHMDAQRQFDDIVMAVRYG